MSDRDHGGSDSSSRECNAVSINRSSNISDKPVVTLHSGHIGPRFRGTTTMCSAVLLRHDESR